MKSSTMSCEENTGFFKYLNTSADDHGWGFQVTSVGYSRVQPHEHYPVKKHPKSHELTWSRGRILNDYYLVFIPRGKGLFCSGNTNEIEVGEGACFFLYPGVWHRYKPDAGIGWEEYWIGFNGFYAEELMDKHFKCGQPCVSVGSDKGLLLLFNKVFDLIRDAVAGYAQQIAGIAVQMLGVINSIALHKQLNRTPVERLISRAKFILQESLENPVDMEQLCRQLPMGYVAFRKNFKRITGYAPHQYHLNLRIEKAKELLASTVLSIDEISWQTGFDLSYFSKLFKRKTGMSPNAYRKQIHHSHKRYPLH